MVAIAFPEMGGLKAQSQRLEYWIQRVAIAFPEMGGLKDILECFSHQFCLSRNRLPRDGWAERVLRWHSWGGCRRSQSPSQRWVG